MKLVRRRFLKLGLFSSVLSQVPVQAKARGPKKGQKAKFSERFPYSIIQGATDESRAQFSVLHNRDESLSFVVKDELGSVHHPDRVDIIEFESHSQSLAKPYFSGLNLGVQYQLELYNDDSQKLDSRYFKTLDLQKKNLRFAIASCMDEAKHEPKIWQDMISKRPDVILFVGDSVYADRDSSAEYGVTANPELLWIRFCEARKTLEIYQSEVLVPIFATWDDHDFGRNDTGMSYPYVTESQKNFMNFFAQEESHCRGLLRGPGVSSALFFNNQMFLLLDDRSFRQDGEKTENAHWGTEQVQWALGLIEDFDGFVWICNGSQVFPAMVFKESVSAEHPKQLESFVGALRDCQAKVAFISGDVHFSEISKIEKEQLGYVTYEFTSSSIHSGSFPGIPDIIPNKRRVAATGKRNYLLIDSIYNGDSLKMKVASHSKSDRVNFEKQYEIGHY